MKSIVVVSAVLDSKHNRMEVVKEITNDDNSKELNLHTFSLDALEWRAAEYDLDNIDDAIDSIIYEPYIEPIRPLHISTEEAKTQNKVRITEAKNKLKINGRDVIKLKAHMTASGLDSKYIDSADEDPYDTIKRTCHFDLEVLYVKREHIRKLREYYTKSKIKPNIPNKSRVEKLQERLDKIGPKNNKLVTSNDSSTDTKSGTLDTIVLGKRGEQRGHSIEK